MHVDGLFPLIFPSRFSWSKRRPYPRAYTSNSGKVCPGRGLTFLSGRRALRDARWRFLGVLGEFISASEELFTYYVGYLVKARPAS